MHGMSFSVHTIQEQFMRARVFKGKTPPMRIGREDAVFLTLHDPQMLDPSEVQYLNQKNTLTR